MTSQQDRIEIIDCTIRDGGYAIDFAFSAADTRAVTKGLVAGGIRWMEVGHGIGLGGSRHDIPAKESDVAYIEAVRDVDASLNIGAFYIPGVGTLQDIEDATNAGMNFIRIGSDVTRIKDTRHAVDHALGLGLYVCVNLMKTYAVSPDELSAIAAELSDWGFNCLTVVDSAGCMSPRDVARYVRATRQNCDMAIGFHGHNNFCVANANCLVAVEMGATLVDTSLRGMGRSAGNAQTETVAHLLALDGHTQSYDPFALMEAAESVILPLMRHPQGLSPMELVTGMSKFHSSFLPHFESAANRHNVNLYRLIMDVSAINCVNPSKELIESKAAALAKGAA